MINTVIFDMDGTIVDSMPVWKYAASRYVRSQGYEPAPELDDMIFSMTISQYIEHIKKEYSIDKQSDKIAAEIHEQMIKEYESVPEKAGATALLRALKLKGIRLVLATSTDEEIAKPVLKRLNMWELFEKHYCAVKKSSPDIFRKITDELKLSADECFMVDDSDFVIKNAKAAGIKTVGVYDEVRAQYNNSLKNESDLYYISLDNTDSIIKDMLGK